MDEMPGARREGPEPVGGHLAAARVRPGLDGVDVEVERPRVLGVRLHHALERRQDLGSLRLHAAVGLPEVPRPEVHERVGEERRGVEIVGEALRQVTHRVGVLAIQRRPIPRGRGRVPLRERLDGRPLPRRDAAGQRHGLLDRRERGLLPLDVRRAVVVRSVGERDAPVAHRALGIESSRLAERTLGLDVVEAVHQAQTLVEVRLGLGRRGADGLVVTAEALEKHGRRRARCGVVVRGGLRGARRQDERQDAESCREESSHVATFSRIVLTARVRTHRVPRGSASKGRERGRPSTSGGSPP